MAIKINCLKKECEYEYSDLEECIPYCLCSVLLCKMC